MDRVQKSHFSTASLAPRRRLPIWRQSIATLFDIQVPRSASVSDFQAELVSYLLDERVMLSHCTTRSQRFERESLRLARDGLDHYLIQTHLRGHQQVARAGRRHEVGVGDLMVIDLAERHHAQAADFSHLTLVVPRSLLAPLLQLPDDQHGKVLRGDAALVRLAVNHIKTLYRSMECLAQEAATQIVYSTVQLLATALNGSADSTAKGHDAVRSSARLQACELIERRLHAPDFDVAALCQELGLARATLHRLFEREGGVMAHILERRLRRCVQTLISPRHVHRRIQEIACSWGFSSEADFSRAFRRHFGLSPAEVRQLLLDRCPATDQKNTGQDHADRRYERWLAHDLRLCLPDLAQADTPQGLPSGWA